MGDFLTNTLAFIVAISVLVAVHEYGHFWVARKLGFKVLRYSIGFGSPLLRWRSKDPDQYEYWISAIPLGGYVKMLDEREGEVPPEEVHRAFNRRPVWARILVLLAGPGANFLFAILAYWVVYVSGVAGVRPYIDSVQPDSVAAAAGLRGGDVIERIGSEEIETLDQTPVAMFDAVLGNGMIDLSVVGADGDRREVTLDVRGRVGELTEPDALFDGLGIIIGPRVAAVMNRVIDDSPAERAGMRAGDRVIRVDDEPITSWSDFTNYVRARPGETVQITVERDGQEVALAAVELDSVDEEGGPVGRVGAEVVNDLPEGLVERLNTERRYGLIEGLGVATRETWEMSALTVRVIGRMITGDVSLKNASGPIMIATYAGDYVQAGFNWFLRFLAMISISLGVMNLLPIPILDGGQIVMSTIEGIKGSPLSMRAAILGQQIGIAMLIVLMGVVFYNDITRLLAP